jgi:hypothetical protein
MNQQGLFTLILVGILCFGASGAAEAEATIETEQDTGRLSETPQQDWSLLLEEMLENYESEVPAEKWEEKLAELAENPIDLNSASKETLESIPFLNESQIEGLCYYQYRFGPMASLSELLLIEGMDEQTLRWLRPFVCLENATGSQSSKFSTKKALKFGKQEIRGRWGRSLQKKLGYTKSDKSYLGDPNQLGLRYGFNYKGNLQWGVVLEKDAGERLWSPKNGGIDYLSLHFLLKGQKRIKSFILGDYNLRLGQGLVCGSAFSLGKNTAGTALEQTGSTLSRHFSSSESGFFRGIGTTLILKPYTQKTFDSKSRFGLELTTFVSRKKIDAAVADQTFSTISSTGLHRTDQEAGIRDKLCLSALGAHLAFRTEYGQYGLTTLMYGFDSRSQPEPKPYNLYYFRGKRGGNLALDYRFRYRGMLFFGEMALDDRLEKAILSGISLKPCSTLDFSVLVRNFAPGYNAYFANAFSEGTATKNEYGLFATLEWRFIKKWRLNACYDLFVFPWLKYGVNAPSVGTDYSLQATWCPNSASQLQLRFKSKRKEKNADSNLQSIPPLEIEQKDQWRFQATTVSGSWSLKTVLDGNRLTRKTGKTCTWGFSASQEVSCSPKAGPFGFSLRYALFDTDDFDNRIYSYERDLPGSFSMNAFYGQGSRLSLLMRCRLTKQASLQLKAGHSFYRDRDQVGTALEQVEGYKLTDIRGMIAWKF